MNEKSDIYAFLKEHHPWSESSNNLWLATTLQLHRNLTRYLFPAKLDKSAQEQVDTLLFNALNALPDLSFPLAVRAETIGPNDRQMLSDQFLTSDSFQQAHGSEAFGIDKTGKYFAVLNIRDHLILQYNDAHAEIEHAWNQLAKIDSELGKALSFSFSQRFGFLTADPFLCGTGLVVRAYLHLPALVQTGKIRDKLEQHRDERVLAGSLQGDLKEPVGNVITLINAFRLGITEEDIISAIRAVSTKLIVEEKAMRTQIRTEESPALKNKISRSYGLLAHSYELDPTECLNAISLCKLGVELEWIKGIDQKTLNRLFFTCRRAHLLGRFGQMITQEEIALKRARLLKEAMETASLEI